MSQQANSISKEGLRTIEEDAVQHIANWIERRVEDGELDIETLAKMIGRYAIKPPVDSLNEIIERMEAGGDDGEENAYYMDAYPLRELLEHLPKPKVVIIVDDAAIFAVSDTPTGVTLIDHNTRCCNVDQVFRIPQIADPRFPDQPAFLPAVVDHLDVIVDAKYISQLTENLQPDVDETEAEGQSPRHLCRSL
jgi:hypothetical protein